MVHVWQHFFEPALGFALAAIGLFVAALAFDLWHPTHEFATMTHEQWRDLGLVIVPVAAAILTTLVWEYRSARPNLGVPD